jgi:general secretion pathway protein I
MTASRAKDAGFTLIETLVALAVLAMSAVALLATTQAHITRIAGLETRAAAAWVAENHLTEITLGLRPGDLPPPMLGFQFSLAVEATETTDPDLRQLVISATDTADGLRYARLTGFALADVAPRTSP